jgi:DNA-directed RNA polymerase subunit alpha
VQATEQEIQAPDIRVDEEGENYARVVAEPLERGFATTLGNALRRVLLSGLQGAAVTSVQIDGVLHEFTSIPHVKEDVIEFLLNVKQIRLRPLIPRPGKMVLDISGRVGAVTAGDIQVPTEYEIINPDAYLATLDSGDANLRAEFTVDLGRGYVPASHGDGQIIGVIPVDAIFTPVIKANYHVERTHLGQETSLERLVLEVWTDGTIGGVEAVAQSAEMLSGSFAYFANLSKPMPTVTGRGLAAGKVIAPELYNMPVEDLNLSVRAYNCLKRSGIATVGQILEKSEEELLGLRNFGRKSYDEMRARLIELGILKPDDTSLLAPSAMVEPPSVMEEELHPAIAQAQEGSGEGDDGEEMPEWQRQLLRLRREVKEE